MSLQYISSAFKTHLHKIAPGKDYRVHIDFRQQEYPELTGATMAYNPARSGYNFPGSHSAFIGTANYPSSGLVARWSFDDGSGTTVTDDSGNGYDGTASGGMAWTAGVAGKAGSFDAASSQYVDIPDTVGQFGAADFSVSGWIKTTASSGTIISRRRGTDNWWRIQLNPTSQKLRVEAANAYPASYATIDSDVAVNDGTFHHFAAVRSSGTIYIYLDGSSSGSGTASFDITDTDGDTLIGAVRTSSILGYFDGLIDDVRIYSRALTETEIEYLYNVRANVLSDIEPDYLVEMPETFTMRLVVRPWFDFDTTLSHRFAEWHIDSTNRFIIDYAAGLDLIQVYWSNGGTARVLRSQRFDDGTTYTNINQWLTIDVAIDLSTGTTAGSQLWINRTSQDTTWSGNIDAKTSSFPRLSFGHEDGANNVETEYAYAMLIPDYVATDADVQNDYADVKAEQIIWTFDGHGMAHTRCTIGQAYEINADFMRSNAEERIPTNTATISVLSKTGEFADDQYAAFDPANEVYNGTSEQAYLQRAIPVEVEAWYDGDWEPIIRGRVDDAGLQRSTMPGDVSRVTFTINDNTVELQSKYFQYANHYEDYTFCDASNAGSSVLHALVREATRKSVFNHVNNASFENATITNAWTATDTTDLSRQSGGLFGSYYGQYIVDSGGTEQVYQAVYFDDISFTKFNIGESWTFSVFVKCATTRSFNLKIAEYNGGSSASSETSESESVTGGAYWQRFTVTHTIAATTMDRVRLIIEFSTDDTYDIDGAVFVIGDEAPHWFVDNTTDGDGVTDGNASLDDYAEGKYDIAGFDTDELVDVTHSWLAIGERTNLMGYIEKFAQATAARFLGFDSAGTLRYRSPFAEGYADPSSFATFDGNDVASIQTNISESKANHVIVHGTKIIKQSFVGLYWTASGTLNYSMSGKGAGVSIANGGYFPDPDTFGFPYIAQYAEYDEQSSGFFPPQAAPQRYVGGGVIVMRGRRRFGAIREGQQVIGLKDAALRYYAVDSSNASASLTQTYFDTTNYSNGAHLLLKNETGGTVTLVDAGIVGKIVVVDPKYGWIHDRFIDWESVRRNGLLVYEIDNDMVVTKDLTEKLADWHWKLRKQARHEYVCEMKPGAWVDYYLGEWFSLDVGASGAKENIDSTVEIHRINWSYSASSGVDHTVMYFREVQENWKKNSNAIARFVASGKPANVFNRDYVVVASSTEVATEADFYCDGTNDDVEIQAAIDFLNQFGGGEVRLSRGTFYIGDGLQLYSGIALRGAGTEATVVEKNVDDYAVWAAGSSGSELTGIEIRQVAVTRNASDTNQRALIRFDYVDNSVVSDVYANDSYGDGIHFEDSDNCSIIRSRIRSAGTVTGDYGIEVRNCESVYITGSEISDCHGSGVIIRYGQYDVGNVAGKVVNCDIHDNGANGIAMLDLSNFTFTGNTIHGNTSAGIASFDYCTNCTYNSNVITNNGTDGIRGPGRRAVVNGNTISDNGDDGIELFGSSSQDNTTIASNVVERNGDYGIDVVNGENRIISGNTVRSNTTKGIRISSASRTVVTGNRSTLNGGIEDNATFTNGDATVTNADTTGFTVGDPVVLDGDQIGTVSSITSGTEFELSSSFSDTTGAYDYRVLDDIVADNFDDSGTNTTTNGNDFN